MAASSAADTAGDAHSARSRPMRRSSRPVAHSCHTEVQRSACNPRAT